MKVVVVAEIKNGWMTQWGRVRGRGVAVEECVWEMPAVSPLTRLL